MILKTRASTAAYEGWGGGGDGGEPLFPMSCEAGERGGFFPFGTRVMCTFNEAH